VRETSWLVFQVCMCVWERERTLSVCVRETCRYCSGGMCSMRGKEGSLSKETYKNMDFPQFLKNRCGKV